MCNLCCKKIAHARLVLQPCSIISLVWATPGQTGGTNSKNKRRRFTEYSSVLTSPPTCNRSRVRYVERCAALNVARCHRLDVLKLLTAKFLCVYDTLCDELPDFVMHSALDSKDSDDSFTAGSCIDEIVLDR